MRNNTTIDKGMTLEVIAFIVPCINLVTAVINLYTMIQLLP